MFKRMFFAMLGLGTGALIGTWAVRKLERAQQAVSPAGVGEAAARQVGGVAARWRAAVTAGRRAAADKEAELRAVYRGGTTAGSPDSAREPAGRR